MGEEGTPLTNALVGAGPARTIASRKFRLDNRELVIHMQIDCLHVLPDGKIAQLSGVVTRTSYPDVEDTRASMSQENLD